MADTMDWLTGIAFVLGLWILVSPFVLGATGTLQWSGVVAGVLIAALSAFEYTREETASELTWSAWAATILGLWVLVSPFVLGDPGMTMQWSNVIAGIVVAIVSGYTGYSASEGTGRGAPQA